LDKQWLSCHKDLRSQKTEKVIALTTEVFSWCTVLTAPLADGRPKEWWEITIYIKFFM